MVERTSIQLPAEEIFYDEGGKRQDAALHNPILRAGDYPIDEAIMAPIRARNRAKHVEAQQQKSRAARWQRVKAKAAATLAKGRFGLYKVEHDDEPASASERAFDPSQPRDSDGKWSGGGGGSEGGGSSSQGRDDSRRPEGSGQSQSGQSGTGAGGDGEQSRPYSREGPTGLNAAGM